MKPNPSVYIIKPKYIFKSPFLKYDLQNPTNREAQNEELTEYFNYGFNEDTMNIYVKLVNRTLKVLDHKKNLEYFDEPSELMRLNDEIPMDLGGFCKFYDPQVFKNDFIQNDQQLLKNFLFNIVKATWMNNGKEYPNYPMLEFIKSMYPPKIAEKDAEQNNNDFEDNPLPSMVKQIAQNLQAKYEQTMRKLIEQKNQPKQVHPSSLPFKKGGKFERKPRFNPDEKQRIRVDERKQQKAKSSSSSSQSSSSSSSSDSSSSESEDERKKRQRDRRDSRKESSRRSNKRQRSKDRERRSNKERTESKRSNRYDESDKSRKIKKRSEKRSRSRDNRENKRSRR